MFGLAVKFEWLHCVFCLVFGAQLGCLDNNHKILVVKDFNNVWVCLDLSSSSNDFVVFCLALSPELGCLKFKQLLAMQCVLCGI